MSDTRDSVRIGCGSGYSRDRADAAAEMAKNGDVEYLCCDRLAERTLANASTRKHEDPSKGYNPLLVDWFNEVLPICHEKEITIIGNFGAANPEAAGDEVVRIAKEHGFDDLKVATITGDNVVDKLDDYDLTNFDTGEPLVPEEIGEAVTANAYIGADPIVEALKDDADVIIGGRIGDLSLYLGAMMYEFDWDDEDVDKKAAGSAVAHLAECGNHSVGGNLAYPGYVEVPGLDNLGLPLAEVYEDGEAIIGHPEGTGGVVSELSLAAQLLYEVHDPANYLTPDVTVDMRDVELEQVGENEVKVTGAKGKPKPDDLKVLVGIADCHIGEFECGWAGRDALDKAELTIEEAIKPTLDELDDELKEVRIDRIGVDAIHGDAAPEPACDPNEVRVRVAFKTDDEETAQMVLDEIEPQAFFCASGGGGLKRSSQANIGVYPTLMPREAVDLEVQYVDLAAPEART